MPDPKIRTQSTFPAVLTIDGVDLDIRVKRMTNTEYDDYSAGFDRWNDARGDTETPAAKAEREAAVGAWMRESLDAYLAFLPGQHEHDGRETTKGGDLLDIYGGRGDVVPQALAIILFENRLTAEEKKTYKSHLDLLCGWRSVPLTAVTGSAQAPTVVDAAPSDSAADGAVTAASSPASSGMTGLSC